jgi:hypothetical protein
MELYRVTRTTTWAIANSISAIFAPLPWVVQLYHPDFAKQWPVADMLLFLPFVIFICFGLGRLVLYAPYLLYKKHSVELEKKSELDVEISGLSGAASGLIPNVTTDPWIIFLHNTRITNRAANPVSLSFMLRVSNELSVPMIQRDLFLFLKRPTDGVLFSPINIGAKRSVLGHLAFLVPISHGGDAIVTQKIIQIEITYHISTNKKIVEVGGSF